MKNADVIMATMSLEEKIAQTFMVDFRTWNGEDMTILPEAVADAVSRYKFGSFILFANNLKTTEDTLNLTKALQQAVTGKGGLPMIITADQEGGIVIRLGSSTPLPGNMALTASGKPENARISGRIIANELLALGINSTLAPVLDVNCNANNPVIGLRSFGDDPALVSDFGIAFNEGLMEKGLIGCVKHFPGHGDTAVDSHLGLPLVDKSYEELKKCEFIPFAEAVKKGTDMVMTAHILYPRVDDTKLYSEKTGRLESRPATMSHKILTDILRGEMGFEGVICTDALNMAGVAANFGEVEAAVHALAAGADMLCMPAADIDNTEGLYRFDALIDGIKEAVEKGVLPLSRIDDAVKRIINLKLKYKITEYDEEKLSLEDAVNTLGNVGFRAEERRMAQEAVTLVRSEPGAVPLRPGKEGRILFMVPYANEADAMIKGFKRARKELKLPESVQAESYWFNKKDYDISGSMVEALDRAGSVIIISEIASVTRMSYDSWFSCGVKNVTEYCRKNGKTCIVISVDKPYDVQLYPDASAVLAVYGDKAAGPNLGAGVEAALGVFPMTGRLPVDVPKFDAEKCAYSSEIIYPRGHAKC